MFPAQQQQQQSPFTDWSPNINSTGTSNNTNNIINSSSPTTTPGEDFVQNCLGTYFGQTGKDYNILKIARRIFDEKILPYFRTLVMVLILF